MDKLLPFRLDNARSYRGLSITGNIHIVRALRITGNIQVVRSWDVEVVRGRRD
jgi:hypothetical protein